jgi:hypothetical protein
MNLNDVIFICCELSNEELEPAYPALSLFNHPQPLGMELSFGRAFLRYTIQKRAICPEYLFDHSRLIAEIRWSRCITLLSMGLAATTKRLKAEDERVRH